MSRQVARTRPSQPKDISPQLPSLDEIRDVALTTRPDLMAAVQSVELANINHRLAIANGSAETSQG